MTDEPNAASQKLVTGGLGLAPSPVRPQRITEEMVRLATRGTTDPWHIAANLNAMREHGYCPNCGLVPAGCEREGCGQKRPVQPRRNGAKPHE